VGWMQHCERAQKGTVVVQSPQLFDMLCAMQV